MKRLIPILLFIGLQVQAQIPVFRLTDDFCHDESGNNFALSLNGTGNCSGISYSGIRVEGSYSWLGGDDQSIESDGPYTFADRSFTFSTNMRFYTLYGGYRGIFSNKENDGSYGFHVNYDESSQKIIGSTGKSGSTDGFTTADNSVLHDVWYHLVMTFRESGSVTVYLDGVKQDLSDSTILTDWSNLTDTLAVGGFTGRVQTRELLNGYLDNFQFYSYPVSDAQADSLYDNRAVSTYQLGTLGGGSAVTYNPPQFRIYKDGVEKRPWKDGVLKYFKRSVPASIPSDSIQIYFAENFESLPDMTHATILQYWKPLTSFYWEASQSIVDIDGDYNKVWSSTYHEGREGQADGYELFIPFSDTTNEIWFESSEWADAGFNGYSTLCYYSGKIMNGVYGGRTPLYNYPYAVDSSAYGNGWGVDGEWGSASGGCYSGNAPGIWPYYGDAEGYYLTLQPFGTLPRDTWTVWTRRIKINTPGKADGILEWYTNGVLVQQRTDVIWRSVAAAAVDQNNVDGILYRYTTGGGSGPNYISSRDNVTRHDNLIAYKYLPGSDNYLTGAAPEGHTIPIVAQAVDGLANVYPESSFANESFTATSGTIQSHYSGVFHVPQSTTIYTKTISGHSNPIRLSFTYWHDGWNNSPGEDCWVKIYSGIGPDKTWVATYQETADGYPPPTIGETIQINNTACTIEYYPGRDFSAGWKIYFW